MRKAKTFIENKEGVVFEDGDYENTVATHISTILCIALVCAKYGSLTSR